MVDSQTQKQPPGWRDLPYPRTSFDQAIKLTPVDGVSGLYKAFRPQDWSLPRTHYMIAELGSIFSIITELRCVSLTMK